MLAMIFYPFVLTRTTQIKLCKHLVNRAENVSNGITCFEVSTSFRCFCYSE